MVTSGCRPLDGLNGDQVQALVIAYEPIQPLAPAKPPRRNRPTTRAAWCAASAHMFDDAVAQATRVSTAAAPTTKTLPTLCSSPKSTRFIGGAALKAESYCAMVNTTADLYA
ncbi:MAG: triose-phosphate isomerase [Caldilineaceae bacterium]